MAADSTPPAGLPVTWLVGLVRRTRFAVRAALSRRDGRATAAVVTPGYFVLYAVGLGHLGSTGGTEWSAAPAVDAVVVADPLATATEQIAPFQYEPVALVAVGPVETFSRPSLLLSASDSRCSSE